MKKVLLTFSLALWTLPLAAARVEIVLDVSGSMRAAAGNMSRMEAAQRAVRATVEAIDPSSNVALRLYGHRLPSEPKDASCRDTELVIPFGPLDKQRFINAINSAKPLGQTPLAFALEQAAADFGQIGDDAVAVILVSDGEESCGGDPAKIACAFRERGLELTVHTVGFDVNEVARKQLQSVASCTGGEYRDARNAGELADSLRQLTQAGLLIEKKREVATAGAVVRGGNGFGSAVGITAGTYRLDHHQRPNEYDYFSIGLKPGQLLNVTQSTTDRGVTIEGSAITENNYPIAGVAIYRPDQTLIGEDAKIGAGQKAMVGASVFTPHGGNYYILIGQKYWSGWGISNEAPFTIEVIDATDVGSGTDAGASEKEAVRITPGKHRGWIQPGDGKDVFWFDAAAGQTYQMRVRPEGQAHALQLRITDDDGVQLAGEFSPNPEAAVRVENIVPKRSGRLYATLTQVVTGDAVPYDLELTGGGGAATTTTAGDTTAGTETAAAQEEERKGLLSYIPGGGITCAAIVLIPILILIVVILLIVRMVRKRKAQP